MPSNILVGDRALAAVCQPSTSEGFPIAVGRAFAGLLRRPGALWCAAGLHFAHGAALWMLAYHKMHMAIWDTGVFDQVVWNCSNGNWFRSSVEVQHFLSDHFMPLLAVFGLLHHLVPSPYCMMIVQQAAFSGAGLLLAWMVRSKTGSTWAAWVCALLVWCHPSSGIVRFDCTILPIALPFIIVLYWFGLRGNYFAVALTGIFLLLIKEDMGIAMAAVGLLLYFSPNHRMLGLVLFAIGCLATYFFIDVVIGYTRGGAGHYSYSRVILTPSAGLAAMTSQFIHEVLLGNHQWAFILKLFGAVLFLPLLTGRRMLALFFSCGHMLLMPDTLFLNRHYATIPYAVSVLLVFIVVCEVIPNLRRPRLKKIFHAWLIVAVAVSLGTTLWRDGRNRLWLLRPDPRRADFEEVASMLPPDAPVAASLTAGAYLAHRPIILVWPEEEYRNMLQEPLALCQAQYILSDAKRERHYLRDHHIAALRQNPDWEMLMEKGDFTLFRKKRFQANADDGFVAPTWKEH